MTCTGCGAPQTALSVVAQESAKTWFLEQSELMFSVGGDLVAGVTRDGIWSA